MGDTVPIDPALMASDEPYRSSLSGIFPSSRSNAPERASDIPRDQVDGHLEQSENEGTPSGGKKRKKTEGDDDKPKKSRQSRESLLKLTAWATLTDPLHRIM